MAHWPEYWWNKTRQIIFSILSSFTYTAFCFPVFYLHYDHTIFIISSFTVLLTYAIFAWTTYNVCKICNRDDGYRAIGIFWLDAWGFLALIWCWNKSRDRFCPVKATKNAHGVLAPPPPPTTYYPRVTVLGRGSLSKPLPAEKIMKVVATPSGSILVPFSAAASLVATEI